MEDHDEPGVAQAGSVEAKSVAVVIPILNDWSSLQQLLPEVVEVLAPQPIHIFLIDDGSASPCPRELAQALPTGLRHSIELIELSCNLGHQRAVCIGLVEAQRRGCFGAVIVIDADGEDRPADIRRLLERSRECPNALVVAERTERSEGPLFVACYAAYRFLFAALTGCRIGFGNFCLIPGAVLERLVFDSRIWMHLAAAIVRSRLPLEQVPTRRGTRYDGRSTMSFPALLVHGLSAVSVFSDVLFARLLIAVFLLAALTCSGLGAVVGVRLFTALAIPGWASYVTGLLLVILLQLLMFLLGAVLLVLSTRMVPPFLPIVDCPRYVRTRKLVVEG